MSDLIDRNLIAELVDSHGNVHWEDIAELPSEQPEVGTQMSSADCISRQDAIDALFALYEYHRSIDPTEAADLVRQGIYLAEKKIEDLPSVQPDLSPYGDKLWRAAYERGKADERVRGTWKRTYLDLEAMGERSSIFYCSECSQCIAYPTNYCPSCGARMDGGK